MFDSARLFSPSSQDFFSFNSSSFFCPSLLKAVSVSGDVLDASSLTEQRAGAGFCVWGGRHDANANVMFAPPPRRPRPPRGHAKAFLVSGSLALVAAVQTLTRGCGRRVSQTQLTHEASRQEVAVCSVSTEPAAACDQRLCAGGGRGLSCVCLSD